MDNNKQSNESAHSDTSQQHEQVENSMIFSNINQFTKQNESAVSFFYEISHIYLI